MSSNATNFVASLPDTLRDRVLCRSKADLILDKKFVLYLPTVVLRKRHNPGFALACRLANKSQVPVLVLCTVLDDEHLTIKPIGDKPVCNTARRYAFTLEALQSCCQQFEEHGAGVAVRVHGPGSRTPDHLSMVHKAMAVVTDESFVEPFRTYVHRVTKTCQAAKVPFWSVDGSTTVPPKCKLRLVQEQNGELFFAGVPSKAWMWEKNTEPKRRGQVYGVIRDNHLDAPKLNKVLPPNFFLRAEGSTEAGAEDTNDLLKKLPAHWKKVDAVAPAKRPWTVSELLSIEPKEWVMSSWPSADTTVPPCQQTHGSEERAKERWQTFLQCHLKHYAKRRNQIVLVHAVSRVSCYLNLGILSIFDVVSDIWKAKSSKMGLAAGCNKFLEEIIKWREIGYVHSFATPAYHRAQVLPKWSLTFLKSQQNKAAASASALNTYARLETATSSDETWNAMQTYLIDTGELHNNARMTWGKTAVHWLASAPGNDPETVLWKMCCLNDRFALDGLSPPSYAGILWCFGWCDKPDSDGKSITTKWAHRYRTGPDDFEHAKQHLDDAASSAAIALHDGAVTSPPRSAKRARITDVSRPSSKPITAFFSPKTMSK